MNVATASQPPEGLRVVFASDVCALGEFERCVICVWHLQPTQETFDRRNRELLNVVKLHPGRSCYVDVIEPTSKAPPDQLRKLAVQVFRELDKDLACIAFLVDGSELRSALARAVLTTLTFLLPQVQPSKVFRKSLDVAHWMRPRIGHDDSFDARFVAALDFLRRVPPQSSSSST